MITNTFTAERHFDSLYKKDREFALINMIKDGHDNESQYAHITDALANAFDWTDSSQGYIYWIEIYDALEEGTYDELRADQKGKEYHWQDDENVTNVLREWSEAAAEGFGYGTEVKAPLPEDAAERKTYPIYSGFINYFPNAIAKVSHLSYKGSQQHNPDQPTHWDMSKSGDELDALMRHMIDGDWEQVAWRAMANLERKLTGNCQYVADGIHDDQGHFIL